MKETLLTCPFTGCTFTALEDLSGNIYFRNPLTGEDLKMNYNCSIDKFNLPRSFFRKVETVTPSEAAEILEVSRQRISAIMASNVIKPVFVNGKQCLLKTEVLEYKENRKVGAPRKGE